MAKQTKEAFMDYDAEMMEDARNAEARVRGDMAGEWEASGYTEEEIDLACIGTAADEFPALKTAFNVMYEERIALFERRTLRRAKN